MNWVLVFRNVLEISQILLALRLMYWQVARMKYFCETLKMNRTSMIIFLIDDDVYNFVIFTFLLITNKVT